MSTSLISIYSAYTPQTHKAVHIVVQTAKEGTLLERKIPLVTIKSIGMSMLRDDWMVGQCFNDLRQLTLCFPQCLNVNASEEGDPVFSCYFKTELATNLLQLTSASITLLVAPRYVHKDHT